MQYTLPKFLPGILIRIKKIKNTHGLTKWEKVLSHMQFDYKFSQNTCFQIKEGVKVLCHCLLVFEKKYTPASRPVKDKQKENLLIHIPRKKELLNNVTLKASCPLKNANLSGRKKKKCILFTTLTSKLLWVGCSTEHYEHPLEEFKALFLCDLI